MTRFLFLLAAIFVGTPFVLADREDRNEHRDRGQRDWHDEEEREDDMERWGDEDEEWDGDDLFELLEQDPAQAIVQMGASAGLKPEQVRALLADAMPHLVKQLEKELRKNPEEAFELLEELERLFHEFQELREVDPELANRRAEYHRLKYMARGMGAHVERLRRQARRNASPQVKEAAAHHEAQLHKMLNRLFELRQEHTTYEVQDLEAEIEELKELKQERTENREAILEGQFRKLTRRSTDDW